MMKKQSATAAYLEKLFGGQVRCEPWSVASSLPLYLSALYEWRTAEMFGKKVLFMRPLESIPGAATLEKHLSAARARFGGPTAVELSGVSANTRARLIAAGIPFIVPGEQLFFPELGIALRERYSPIVSRSERLSPAAQRLVILLLLGRVPPDASATEIADLTGYTATSAGRMLDALEKEGLAESVKSGKKRRLKPFSDRKEFWNQARPFLSSPVARKLPLREAELPHGALHAGYLALSRVSDLAEPNRPEYALDARSAAFLKKRDLFLAADEAADAPAILQVWSYSPIEGREPGIVDPFSLYLDLSGDGDERVSIALTEVLEAEWSRV